MSDHGRSGFGEELFRSGFVDTVDEPLTDETSIGFDGVHRSSGTASGGRGGFPGGGQRVAVEGGAASLDDAGDDPLDVVTAVGGDDHRGSRVLEAGGIDAIDRVRAADSGVVVPTDGQVTGERSEVQEHEPSNDDRDPPDASHPPDPTNDDRLVIPRWLKIGGGLFAVFLTAAMAFAIFEPIQVLPRLRLAPGYALTADDGSIVTSEDARGVITLYTFSRTDCGAACSDIDRIMAEVRDRVAAEVDLGDVEFRLVTIALDPLAPDQEDAVGQLRAAAASGGADGASWRWVGGSETELRNIVGAGFRRPYESTSSTEFDPGFILVDGLGVVRGDYRYETLGDTADKLTRHVGILSDELKYANGAAGVAYEAAHLFLCYP